MFVKSVASCMQAKEVMETRIPESALDTLVAELTAYSQGREPFAPSYMPSASMSVKSWWLSLHHPTQATVIITLAVLLYSIVPHAAGNERDFSIMKWLNAPRRSSQSVGTLRRLLRVRTALSSLVDPPRCVQLVQEQEDKEASQAFEP